MRDLTDKQLNRILAELYRRMQEGQGYQPFGHDWPTLRIVNPAIYSSLKRVLAELTRRSAESNDERKSNA